MKKVYFFVCVLMIVLGCKKQKTELPELDFNFKKSYTATQMLEYKRFAKCGETPYWTGKTLSLTGYLFQANINTKERRFALYTNSDVFALPDGLSISYDNAADSAKISSLIVSNKNRYCDLVVKCTNIASPAGLECGQNMGFSLERSEDITFK